jgi:hypothetical protein
MHGSSCKKKQYWDVKEKYTFFSGKIILELRIV